MAAIRRRHWIGRAAGVAIAVVGPPAWPAPQAPFARLAAIDPPFVEEYEVLLAMAPPLARGEVPGDDPIATEADSVARADAFRRAIDPEKTDLHRHFVRALAEDLHEAGVKTVLVLLDPVETEADLVAQARASAPGADAILLTHIAGRFVAPKGSARYVPGVTLDAKLRAAASDQVWLEESYATGYRGIDRHAIHVEVDPDDRFVSFDSLMRDIDPARQLLIRGAEQIAHEIARSVLS